MQGWIKFPLSRVYFRATTFSTNFLENSGIEIVLIIRTYIDTFVFVIRRERSVPCLTLTCLTKIDVKVEERIALRLRKELECR